jgi:hypothetical protein
MSGQRPGRKVTQLPPKRESVAERPAAAADDRGIMLA